MEKKMVEFITDKKDGLQVEDAPNSLRTIAPYIEITLYGLNAAGQSFYEISFRRKMDDQIVQRVVPASLLLSDREIIGFLVNNGFANIPLKEDEKALCNYLRESGNNAPKGLFASKLGWLEDKFATEQKLPFVYVTPDKQYGESKSDLQIRFVQSDEQYNQSMEVNGSLADWKNNVGKYIKYSPLMTLGVCMAFGAIAMKPCGIESYIVHIFGTTSKGKSNIELVAQSIFRKATKNTLPSWDITPIGLMDKCRAFADSIFILDEVTKFPDVPSKLQQMIYRATNGSGKITSFAYAKSVNRVDLNWIISILSSGEKSISQILEEGNVKLLSGREVRCFELSAIRNPKYFTFTSLPKGFKNSAQLAKLLENNTGKYYGTPAREFLRKFLKKTEERIAVIKSKMQEFYEQQGIDDGSIKGRIANRFAFLEAIGLLAIKFKILPMKKSLLKEHIRLLCSEVLAQHKTDEELCQEGIKMLKKALRKATLVKVKQKGKTFTDDEKMAFGYLIMRDKEPSRHFLAVRKGSFDAVFESQHQADVVTRYLKKIGLLTHRQVDFVDFDNRPQFHCLNLDKLRKEGLYK